MPKGQHSASTKPSQTLTKASSKIKKGNKNQRATPTAQTPSTGSTSTTTTTTTTTTKKKKKKSTKPAKSAAAALLSPEKLPRETPEKTRKRHKPSDRALDEKKNKNKTKGNTTNPNPKKKQLNAKKNKHGTANTNSNGTTPLAPPTIPVPDIKTAFMRTIPKPIAAVPLVKATTEFVTRMCLSTEEKKSGKYYESRELKARQTQRDDFKLRMQRIRHSLKRATRKHRKVLKARMKEIQQNQEMVMQMNDDSKGKVLMQSAYGSPRSPGRTSGRTSVVGSPRVGDISAMIMMGGNTIEKRRPASRQRLDKIESRFFTHRHRKDVNAHARTRKKTGLEIGEDFDELLGSPMKKERAAAAAAAAARGHGTDSTEGNTAAQPYFINYMAMTQEEKKGRLLWKKDYDRKARLKQKAEDLIHNPPAMKPMDVPVSHVGKRVWDYSGVPRLPNTAARLEELSSEEDSERDDEDDDDGSTEYSDTSSNQYERPERKHDPDLLRAIFPRPGAVDRRTWAKYGLRFHRLPKEQQQRAIKREKQLYFLDRADKCYAVVERGIATLENYRANSGIIQVKAAATVMQYVLDHLIGLRISAQNMTDEEMADVSGMYCGKLYAVRGGADEGERDDGSGNNTPHTHLAHEGTTNEATNDAAEENPSNNNSHHHDVTELVDAFSMALTEGLASEEPPNIDFGVLNASLVEIKQNLDGTGIQSAMGKRHLGLANLTATFAVERQDLEKNAEKYKTHAQELDVEIKHENKMDQERAKEIKKKYRTPYLSGKKEHKPKPSKCWVCKENIEFTGPQGHMFTFCSSKKGCGAFNQNPKQTKRAAKAAAAAKDPRLKRQNTDLVRGVNTVIRHIGRASAQGKNASRLVWGNFDRLQRKAVVPLTADLGPGSYDIRVNEHKTRANQFSATIADPAVLEKILQKQQRERNAKLATVKKTRGVGVVGAKDLKDMDNETTDVAFQSRKKM